jgi:hypothetical protein
MALLGIREHRARIAFAAMLSCVVGCMLLGEDQKTEELGPAFSHATHVGQGLECSDCHGDADEAEPRMPSAAQCQLCHAELDVEKPVDEQALTVLAASAARVGPWDGGDVIFAHVPHVSLEMECVTCHAGIETSERVEADEHLSMDDCMRCHDQRGTSNACATCHTVLGTDVEPQSHAHDWLRAHGRDVRAGGVERTDRCDLCHTENECLTCHTQVPPENHTNFWRLRGHGVAASMDRQTCAVCHREDSCSSCHAEVMPLSHGGMWGGSKSTHCLSCHFPLKGESCFVCHKSTPSHQLAPPKPPDHTPGMNCIMCHGNGAPLMHADKGDNCNQCHL